MPMPSDKAQSLAKELLEVQHTLGWMDLVIGSIDDAVYVTDGDSRIIFANQYFADLIGQPRVFLLGQLLQEVFDTKQPAAPIKDFIQTDTGTAKNQPGEDSGIYEWQNEKLEKYVFRISQRQLATTGQIVYLAQNITTEYALSKMKNGFIDLASHQLRTPLTAIMTYSHMLHDGMRGEMTAGQKELSTTIIRASERMNRLINDLLTITRVQNTDALTEQADISLSELFTSINSEVKNRVAEKSLNIDYVIPKTADSVYNNAAALREIFSNLLVNAIQYTPPGGRIEVIAKSSGNNVIIAISDTGIGIPADYLSNIFKQFSRAANATVIHPEGTGLGLYVIKVLLDKIGGKITCKSIEKKGTTFTVTVPKK